MNNQNTFIKLLLSQSSSTELDEAIHEWCIINLVDKQEEYHCLCEKTNTVYYQMLNKINQNIILVGFDCLTKHLSHLQNEAAILNKQYHYKKTSKNPNKRLCHHCHKHNIASDEALWITFCKTCWKNGVRESQPISLLGYKLCEKCHLLCIHPTENKKCCSSCYKKTMNSDDMRECQNCGQFKINKDEPLFKNLCSSCFKLHKESLTHIEKRACHQCQELNIPINEPDYKTTCSQCYKLSLKNTPMRACTVCHQMLIKESEPSYKTCCVSCYKQTKKSIPQPFDEDVSQLKNNKNFNMLSSFMINKK